MKFSSALISATLLATAVFAAPEPQASASASMSAASEFASASVSAMYDANASMDIANLLKEGGAKKYDDDDYHHGDYYGHDDKKDDDMIYVVGSEHKHDFCDFLTQTYILNLFRQYGIDPVTGASITPASTTGLVPAALSSILGLVNDLIAPITGAVPATLPTDPLDVLSLLTSITGLVGGLTNGVTGLTADLTTLLENLLGSATAGTPATLTDRDATLKALGTLLLHFSELCKNSRR